MGGLPLVEVPHPVGTISTDALKKVAVAAIESIVAGLTRKNGNAEIGTGGGEKSHDPETEKLISVPSNPAALFHFVAARGWSDGLPVLPPTRAAVDAMIGACRLKRDHVLGAIPPLNGIATVEKLAANAVMAGRRSRRISSS